ncbi:MAG TPA: hypothetical protein VHX38_22445 [Pseudonocardiaceae bacterium]|jgi:hypothetical protein|nr:hypothetical protein [Pseudonocardiaceae bacterium]
MDLTSYVANLRRELAVAAEAGGEDSRALAERLTAPLESAVRLTLLDALSTAADEITRDLAPGSVELRLRGTDPSFVVTAPPTEPSYSAVSTPEPATAAPAAMPTDGDESTMARINVRLPEQLKARIEEAASREKISANVWLVRAATSALAEDPIRHVEQRAGSDGQRLTGWVR